MDEEKKDDGRNIGNNINGYSESQNNSQMVCFSKDNMFDILTRLPATFLWSNTRYTCKSWANMISKSDFAETQLLHAKPGIFIQSADRPHDVRLLEIKDNGEFEVTLFSPHFPGIIQSSCCGIMSLSQGSSDSLLVANPVTMKAVSVKLPPVPDIPWMTCIVRVPHTREFKLFASDWNPQYYKLCDMGYREFFVLRLGKDDSWKKITQELGVIVHKCRPIYVGGNDLYWITKDTVILMDVDTETFQQFPIPQEIDSDWNSTYLKMGNCLSCILEFGSRGFQIHTFNSNLGRWTLHYQINRLDYPIDFIDDYIVFPQVWIHPELIIKSVIELITEKLLLFAYNVKTGTLHKFDALKEYSPNVGLHTNTLLWWKSSLS